VQADADADDPLAAFAPAGDFRKLPGVRQRTRMIASNEPTIHGSGQPTWLAQNRQQTDQPGGPPLRDRSDIGDGAALPHVCARCAAAASAA
jgi:hypothetical protein